MKNVLIILFIILTGLSACKDKCLTCPENEAVINGECQCVGILFNGVCKSKQEALTPRDLRGSDELLTPYYSEIQSCSDHFDFNKQQLFIYLSDIKEYDGKVSAFIALQTEARPTNTYFDKVYYSGLESDKGPSNFDSLSYNWPSAYDYYGFVYVGEEPLGFDPSPEFYTTEIDDQTCYLRPYVKILDKDYVRVTFRYVTADEEVKAECVRLFHK
jgi:hypothetical protein